MIRTVVDAGGREQGAGALLGGGDVWGLLESAGQWGAQQQPFANLCGVFQHFNSLCNAAAGWQRSCTLLSCSAPSRLADPKPASPFKSLGLPCPSAHSLLPSLWPAVVSLYSFPYFIARKIFSNEKSGMKEVLLTGSVGLVPRRRGSLLPPPI